MSERDKKMIEEAEALSPIYWGIAFDYSKIADSEEAREELKRIGKSLYHREEGDMI